MSKNLFTIPEGPAGLTLSFLDGVESLVFIIMYKILNKVVEFIPRDYVVFIKTPHILDVFSKHKDIKRLEINPFEFGLEKLTLYSQVESFRSNYYYKHLDRYLPTLVNLKKLSLDRIGYDLLSFFPHLEKLSASLCYKTNAITRMALSKYKGDFYQSGSDIIDLNELFFPDKLEKLNVDETKGMKLISLEKFTNLKNLILREDFVEDFSFLSHLTKLEKLRLYNTETPIALDQLSMLTELRHLTLFKLALPDDHRVPTKMLNTLEYLRIDSFTNVDSDYMKYFFSQLISLKELHLDGYYLKFIPNGLLKLRIQSDYWSSLSHIQHLTSLEELIIYSRDGVRNSDMKYINRLKNLKKLLINSGRITPISLYDIAGLTNLRRLDFVGYHRFKHHQMKKYLGHIPSLKIYDNQIEVKLS